MQAQRKNVNILSLPKRKEWPQCCRESSLQVRQSHRCQKEKELTHLSLSPDDEVGESQDEGESQLGEERGSMEKKERTSQ